MKVFRRAKGLKCSGCGKALSAGNRVRDMDPADGRLKGYHQRCAPSSLRNRSETK